MATTPTRSASKLVRYSVRSSLGINYRIASAGTGNAKGNGDPPQVTNARFVMLTLLHISMFVIA
jgi:hypothetical protein